MSSHTESALLKQLKAKDKQLEQQKKQIEHFKIQLRHKQREMNKDEQVERFRKEVDELKKEIRDLESRTPIDSKDVDKQVEVFISLLRTMTEKPASEISLDKKRRQIATAIDDLIMMYKWPFRNQDRFEGMKSIAENLLKCEIPVRMQNIVFDKSNIAEGEKQWIETIEDR